MTFWSIIICSEIINWTDITYTKSYLLNLTVLQSQIFSILLKVSIEHFQRLWHANRGRLLVQILSLLELACVRCWDQSLPNLSSVLTLSFEHPSALLLQSQSAQSHLQVHQWCIVHKNPEFENYLGKMYPAEIKDTTESTTSASYLDFLLSIGRDGQLHTSIYDKRDYFNFHITNFPFLSSNIPSSPAYGVFISQLIRYARACSSYECFILRARRLSSKLLKQGYLVERLKSSFRKFYGRYGDLVEQYGVTLSRKLNDILTPDQQWLPYRSDFPPISWLTELDLHRIMIGFHGAFTTGVASQQGTLTLPDTWFRPPFWDLLCSNCWDQIPRTCHVFTRLFTSNTPWYFLDFACSLLEAKFKYAVIQYKSLYEFSRFKEKNTKTVLNIIVIKNAIPTCAMYFQPYNRHVCRGHKYQMAITHKIYSLRGNFPKLTNSLSHKMYACFIKNEKNYTRQTA